MWDSQSPQSSSKKVTNKAPSPIHACFSPPAALETQSAQRFSFSFLLRRQKEKTTTLRGNFRLFIGIIINHQSKRPYFNHQSTIINPEASPISFLPRLFLLCALASLFTPLNSEGQRSLPAIALAQASRAGAFNWGLPRRFGKSYWGVRLIYNFMDVPHFACPYITFYRVKKSDIGLENVCFRGVRS